MFNAVAKNPEWVANTNTTGKLIKMPDAASVGALRNKWVIPEIADDVNAILKAGDQANNIYLKALSAWKFGKVVLNPAAQTRNMLSNSILLDFSGTNHVRQLQLFPRVIKDYMKKGTLYKQALDDGAIGGEFVGTETMRKINAVYLGSQENNLQRLMKVAGTPFKKAGELYQGMEQLAKMVKYTDVLEKTGNRQLAAKEAQKWLFNYGDVPKIIDVVRKSPVGAPFITFTYKALPRIAETAVKNPMKLYKYYAMSKAFNETSRKLMGMSPVDYAREQNALPPWVLKQIGGMPTNLLLPWRDKHGRTLWLNLEYILPVGQAPEMSKRGIGGLVSSPAFNVLADIIKNLDFKNQGLVPPESTQAEATLAITKHIYKTLVPSLAPGGYAYERIVVGALQKSEKTHAERKHSLIPALLNTFFGLKINAVDVKEFEQFKMYEKKKRIKVLNSSFYKTYMDQSLKEEDRDKLLDDIFKKKQKVLDE